MWSAPSFLARIEASRPGDLVKLVCLLSIIMLMASPWDMLPKVEFGSS